MYQFKFGTVQFVPNPGAPIEAVANEMYELSEKLGGENIVCSFNDTPLGPISSQNESKETVCDRAVRVWHHQRVTSVWRSRRAFN
ncbi:hypothetical protein KBC79_01250 [Candidatus Woesebacteria bacterium]|nr:hypothetical protein [Candidatus Woesebacteria bacterium]